MASLSLSLPSGETEVIKFLVPLPGCGGSINENKAYKVLGMTPGI